MQSVPIVLEQGRIQKSAIKTIFETFGNTGVQHTIYNSGRFYASSSLLQDVNDLILDVYRSPTSVDGFACVDASVVPFNYFHAYKYYD